MRVIVEGRVHEGRAVDLDGVPASAVVRAVRGESAPVDVACPTPGPVHDHVARLPPPSFDRRSALVAVARARGHTSPAAATLDEVRTELAETSPPAVGLEDARRRVAEAGTEEERLRERVAELRGRVQARRETGADTTAVEAQLAEATRRLAEAETERIAAEQALERAEATAREVRDQRDRRLELEDRVANLERRIRADLAAAVWEAFRSAVGSVPGSARVGASPGEYEGDSVTAALAIARLASLDAPVVVDSLDRLSGATEATSVLEAPVIYTQ